MEEIMSQSTSSSSPFNKHKVTDRVALEDTVRDDVHRNNTVRLTRVWSRYRSCFADLNLNFMRMCFPYGDKSKS